MAEPKENEEINEELSSEEMKSVSGGISDEPAFRKLSKVDSKYAISDEQYSLQNQKVLVQGWQMVIGRKQIRWLGTLIQEEFHTCKN